MYFGRPSLIDDWGVRRRHPDDAARGGDPLGRGDDAEDPDAARAGFLEQVDRVDRAAAGRQHRVDHQDVLSASPAGAWRSSGRRRPSFRRAAARCGRPRAGHELQAPRPASRDRPEHRNDDHGPPPTRLSGASRGGATHLGPRRQFAQSLGGQQDADADGHAPERVRLGAGIAERTGGCPAPSG